MLYIKLLNGLPVEVSEENPKGGWAPEGSRTGWISSRDIKTFQEATRIARYLGFLTNEEYLPVATGPDLANNIEIIKAPKVGDPVSATLNGDSYPEGYITRITPTWRITTSTGRKFSRLKSSSTWQEVGRGFYMSMGHRSFRNPHF